MGITSPKPSEPLGGFARNEGLKPEAYKLRLFLNAGELGRTFDEMVVNIECRSHMHKYASLRHLLSSNLNHNNPANHSHSLGTVRVNIMPLSQALHRLHRSLQLPPAE